MAWLVGWAVVLNVMGDEQKVIETIKYNLWINKKDRTSMQNQGDGCSSLILMAS